jgi:mitochondrial splicing suppressor protein 51
MKGAYTCLRCLRLLRSDSSPAARSISQAAKKRSIKRSFTSLSATSSNESKFAKTSSFFRPRQHRLNRLAHNATAPVEVPARVERHNRSPDEYGEYRPHQRALLGRNNLFHPFSKSPIPEIRQRGAFTKQHAYCPHPSHQQTRIPTSPNDPESRKMPEVSTQAPAHVHFECPDCGIATYCTEEHWEDDYEAHLEICDTLRQINEDDHDLRSGRWFPEFDYPGPQLDEILVNLTSWDTYLYTRGFEAINEDRSMRQATRLLTYPLTVGSVLHELSPYNIRAGGRLTTEGLKSLSGESTGSCLSVCD